MLRLLLTQLYNTHTLSLTMSDAALRQSIVSNFKLQGLSLKSDASTLLVEVLEPHLHGGDMEQIIDMIIEAIQKQPLKSSLIGRDVVEIAIEECNTTSDADTEKALVIINAFDVPKFSYHVDRKKFLPFPKDSLKLHAGAAAKEVLFKERYTLLYQRTLRHELFTPPALGQPVQSSSKFQLRTVEYLLSSSGLPDKIIVLGMLSQLKEGKFHLEDPTGCVELDLSQCTYHMGLFVESSLVLAEGLYDDKIFHVDAVGFPPPETATDTRNYFGNINFFGGPSSICAKASVKLQAMLQEHNTAMFVFLSDVHLDDPKVMEKLSVLFTGYSDDPPTAFVFMGNFSSTPYGPLRYQKIKERFNSLGDLMLQFPALIEKSHFLFIPGPMDPGPGNILPTPCIPSNLTSGITDRIPSVQFCSNPTRIQFCSQEIVVFRDDVMNKLCRNCVQFPSEMSDLPNHFTKTILSQAHLCPLPLHARPVYWMYDHALRLYPLPDLVVMGDKCDPFTVSSNECTVTNVGSFVRSGFEFKVYVPAKKLVEDSKVMD